MCLVDYCTVFKKTGLLLYAISGFSRSVNKLFALLGCHTALTLLVTDVLGQAIGPIFKDQAVRVLDPRRWDQ